MKKLNWKRGFYLLLGANLLIVIILSILILMPVNEKSKNPSQNNIRDNVSFQVKSNKNDLNRLINQYINKEAADSPIDYQVLLQDEVELYGTLPFFSQQIDLKLTFEPEALENGDLVLNQKSISVGKLSLPVSYVLKIIRDNYKLPKGIDIQPNEQRVYVNMEQLKLKSDIKIQVDKFDLKKDDIRFTLLVPIESGSSN